MKLERAPLHECRALNEVWCIAFVSDSLANGRRIECLAVTDDFSHECVDIAVDHGIGSEYVVRVLDQVARFRGYPRAVRTDQGPEFTSRASMGLGTSQGRAPHPQPAGQAHAERLRGELQRQVSRRAPERALVPKPEAGTRLNRALANRLLRGAAACHRQSSQRYIDSQPAAPCRRRRTPRSNLLQTSGFLTTAGTGIGDKSAALDPKEALVVETAHRSSYFELRGRPLKSPLVDLIDWVWQTSLQPLCTQIRSEILRS